jgi:hypothetical protein
LETSLSKKSVRPHFNKTCQAWWCVPAISATREATDGKITVQAQAQAKSETLLEK